MTRMTDYGLHVMLPDGEHTYYGYDEKPDVTSGKVLAIQSVAGIRYLPLIEQPIQNYNVKININGVNLNLCSDTLTATVTQTAKGISSYGQSYFFSLEDKPIEFVRTFYIEIGRFYNSDPTRPSGSLLKLSAEESTTLWTSFDDEGVFGFRYPSENGYKFQKSLVSPRSTYIYTIDKYA